MVGDGNEVGQEDGLDDHPSFVMALKAQVVSVTLRGVSQEYSFYKGRRAHLLHYKNTCVY